MRKILIVSFVALLLSATAYANVYGPFPMRISNALPSNTYNYIYVTIDDNYMQGCTGTSGALITVDPNESILIPGSNYGIQSFGLNFNGNPDLLTVDVLDDSNNKWKVTSGGNSSFGPFGVFVYNGDTTGQNRKNPLRISLCYRGVTPLSYYDFYVANGEGYMFACDVAGFSFNSEPRYSDVSSAKFALPAPPATTTTIPSTTTTTVQPTTTTTSVSSTTTTEIPTLVELATFKAIPGSRGVKLVWETESEVDNAGFNMYRAESADGNYIKINDSLIAAQGTSTQGSSYEYVDKEVQNRKTYYYKLEDIDLNGNSMFHGPESATPMWIYGIGK